MFKRFKQRARNWVRQQIRAELKQHSGNVLFLSGQIAAKSIPDTVHSLQDVEFRVYSQYGEDGIIQFLVNRVKPKATSFIEFGVGTYDEANTRFLLMNNFWSGLVMDGNVEHISAIRSDPDYGWKFNLKARHAVVTRDNVNEIFADEGFAGEIGLISIDVDGVDYHLWDAIEAVKPAIVVIEYNRCWPALRPITVPYSPDFDRTVKHPSNFYYGASLGALVHLGKTKGYQFAGIERHQANAFFVRKDLASNVPHDEPRSEYASCEALPQIRGMPVLNVVTGRVEEF